MVLQLVYSVWKRDELRDTTGDPWGGRTLEWLTASPPPFYNFAHTPVVHTLDALAFMKERGNVHQRTSATPTSTCRATPASAWSWAC